MSHSPPVANIVAPAVRDLNELAGQLEAWLTSNVTGRPVRVTEVDYPRGAGLSHETILFTAIWEEQSGTEHHELVVRIKPSTFLVFQDDLFSEQFRLMRALHKSGRVPVAKPLWYEEDPAILGAPFFIMQRKHGRVPVSSPSYLAHGWVFDASIEDRRRLWRSAVEALASLQTVDLTTVEFLRDPAIPDGFDHEWNRWIRFFEMISADRPLPRIADAFAQLAELKPHHRPPGLVWGDARIGNMMFDADFRVTAIMDWEQPSLGGALHDLGWWLFLDRVRIHHNGGRSLEGLGGREETLELWSRLTGIPTDDFDWYEAFAGLKLTCLPIHMSALRGRVLTEAECNELWHLGEAEQLIARVPGGCG